MLTFTSNNIKINYKDYDDHIFIELVELNNQSLPLLEEVLKKFLAAHPNREIELQLLPNDNSPIEIYQSLGFNIILEHEQLGTILNKPCPDYIKNE